MLQTAANLETMAQLLDCLKHHGIELRAVNAKAHDEKTSEQISALLDSLAALSQRAPE